MKNSKLIELYKRIGQLTDESYIEGSGNLDAQILLIGEAPGAKEIELGKPFVGQSGKNLDEFISILGINREDLYITNVVKIRPYKVNEKTGRKVNRPPSKGEVASFLDILKEEIFIISPKIVVTLGNTPLRAVMDNNTLTIGDVHGQTLTHGILTIFPLYHPAAIIYNQSLKDTYIEDLLKLKKLIHGSI